jgi:hypothetical protein
VAGHTFTVNQNGSCSFTLTPSILSVPGTGATGQVTVAAAPGCTWTATTTTSWITLSSTSGSGNGTFTYTIAPNTTILTRSGSISVGGRSLPVSQDRTAAPSTPTNFRVVGGE